MFKPTEENLARIESMIGMFYTVDEIAKAVGATIPTIKKYYDIYSANGTLKQKTLNNTQDSNKKDFKSIETTYKKNDGKLLALDQATNLLGYSIWENGELQSYGVVDFSDYKKDSIKRMFMIKLWLQEIISEEDITEAVIEDIQYENNALTFKQLAKLQGICEIIFISSEIKYDIYSSTT